MGILVGLCPVVSKDKLLLSLGHADHVVIVGGGMIGLVLAYMKYCSFL